MISGEGALLEKGPLSPPPSLLSPNLFNEWEATRREFRWAAFFFGIGIRRITHCPTMGVGGARVFFQKVHRVHSRGTQKYAKADTPHNGLHCVESVPNQSFHRKESAGCRCQKHGLRLCSDHDPILHRPPLLFPIHSGPFRPVWSVPSPYTRKLSSPLSTLRAPVR